MAFQSVTCVVVYRVSVGKCEQDGRPVSWPRETLGDFETQSAAEQALAAAGFTLNSWGMWKSPSRWGEVTRMLVESITG